MLMTRLIYASRLVEMNTSWELQKILTSSRKNNPAVGITGALCYDPDFFLQFIEGPREAVNALYQRILRDPRHDGVLMIDYSEITAREFPSWAMAYISARELDQDMVFKYCASAEFDPYGMSASSAAQFLAEAAKNRRETMRQLGLAV